MGRKGKISRLDPEIRAYIEAMLATGAMTLAEILADLRAKFPAEANAGALPSRAAIGRYGQKLERRLTAIKASTEAARLISEHAGDSQDARSEALTALVQTELFEATSVSWPDVDRAEIACQPLSASMDRVGLRLTYMRSCPHALYDVNCGVNRDQFKVAATVSTLTGSAIEYSSAAMLPDGRAAGGYIEWSIGSGELERRSILAHSGSTLTLLGGTDGLSAGQAITVYPGCRQTTADCHDYFANLDNFGGFPAMPGTSPFDGNPVF